MTEYVRMNEKDPSGMVRLQQADMKKVEDFRVNSPKQWRMWKRGEEACASRLEREWVGEKNV